ncbi:MAG TPA: hypothetical protein VE684_17480 [Crenalkalicoccus sp.]|nr:hypothetical protein [Crenalkalicoccus sp.]
MSRRQRPPAEDHVARYKALLRDALNLRPSGTRQRLAVALGKNRSFISQITNPAYAVPIPAPHLAAILEICHLAPAEREAFLAAYRAAHPHRLVEPAPPPRRHRLVTLNLPDLGPDANRAFDDALRAFVARRARTRGEG